jgi:hypothetical protein
MLTVSYAVCHIQSPYAECHYFVSFMNEIFHFAQISQLPTRYPQQVLISCGLKVQAVKGS